MPISLTVLENVIREAGSIALTHFRDLKNLEVTKKSPRDLVTDADVAVEAFFTRIPCQALSPIRFLGGGKRTKLKSIQPMDRRSH